MDWVTKHAIEPAVAKMSIGGPPNSTLDRAVIKSADGGIRHAIAAGNQASRGLSDVAPAHRAAPRHHDRRRDSPDDSEWIQSSFGRCVDIWGPAVDILTTERGGGTATVSVTSFAAPHGRHCGFVSVHASDRDPGDGLDSVESRRRSPARSARIGRR
ncbi:MAG TPA: hypothetical protein VNR64_08120 [Vicinamibacterales bacterium]|nr:hypothetical protein [Vicinamibacterales bacterium]